MKLCAIVILYNPDYDAKENILKYLCSVDHLIIWDNSPQNKINWLFPSYEEKITWMSSGKNEGIAFALNRGIEYSMDNGYTHLLTMDQDSKWDDFRSFRDNLEIYGNEGYIYCPMVNFQGKKNNKINTIKVSITSGTTYNLKIFKKIGWFREDFFIDGIDNEFGYRAYKNGYSTYQFMSNNLNQRFGSSKKFFNRYIRSYPAIRSFYMIRNHIWLWKEPGSIMEKQMKRWLIEGQIIRKIPKIILAEDDKLKKLCAIFRGVYKGIITNPKPISFPNRQYFKYRNYIINKI